jgi:hypothetical protein
VGVSNAPSSNDPLANKESCRTFIFGRCCARAADMGDFQPDSFCKTGVDSWLSRPADLGADWLRKKKIRRTRRLS